MQNEAIRKAAKASGIKKFVAMCQIHGAEAVHYTSSGRCMQCAAAAKSITVQSAYWKTVSEKYNKAKRERRADDKQSQHDCT